MNVSWMRQEDQIGSITTTTLLARPEEETSQEDPIWEALANRQIMTSMQKLWASASRFWQSVKVCVLKTTQPVITSSLAEST